MAFFNFLSVSLLLATSLLAGPDSKNDRLLFTQNKIKADAGDANSQIYIGIAYGMGMGVPQDDVESTKWFLKAALQGNEMAIGLMGNTYETGKGVPIDKVEALKWYIKASGCNPSFPETLVFTEKVAIWYRDGIGTDKDYQKARSWFNKAAELGSASAYYEIGLLIKNGDGVLADPISAMLYFERAASLGNREAMYQQAAAFETGIGASIDKSKAVTLFEKSSQLGYGPAQYNLGLCYQNGSGVSKDLRKAYSWFLKASYASIWPAQLQLGAMLANGEGCERDLAEGCAWLNLAAEASSVAASSRDGLLKVLSPYDIEAAKRRSRALSDEIAKNNKQRPR